MDQQVLAVNPKKRRCNMPKYVIEREIPNAGQLSPNELQEISQKCCGVLQKLGPQVQWVHSYVTDEKTYCVYIAPIVRSRRTFV